MVRVLIKRKEKKQLLMDVMNALIYIADLYLPFIFF